MRPAKRGFASDSVAGSDSAPPDWIRQAALGKTHSQAALGNDRVWGFLLRADSQVELQEFAQEFRFVGGKQQGGRLNDGANRLLVIVRESA